MEADTGMAPAGRSLKTSSRSGAAVDRSRNDIGRDVVMYLVHFTWISFVLMTILAVASHKASKIHRARAATEFEEGDGLWATCMCGRSWVRQVIAMFMTLLLLIPSLLVSTSLLLGPVLAAVETWDTTDGILYVISNLFGLDVPLTTVAPEGHVAKLLDILIVSWAMMLATTAMGIAAAMALVQRVTDSMPTTALAFLRYLLVYVPICLCASSLALGVLMAVIEDWTVADGFYFVVGQVCGLANPVTDVFPMSAEGAVVEVLAMGLEFALAGAVIGIVGAHPLCGRAIDLIEGRHTPSPESDSDNGDGIETTSATTTNAEAQHSEQAEHNAGRQAATPDNCTQPLQTSAIEETAGLRTDRNDLTSAMALASDLPEWLTATQRHMWKQVFLSTALNPAGVPIPEASDLSTQSCVGPEEVRKYKEMLKQQVETLESIELAMWQDTKAFGRAAYVASI